MKTLKIYNTLSAQIANESGEYATAPEEYANELIEALDLEYINLAEYADEYHGSTYYKKLHKITMTAEWYNRHLYGVAICEVSDDWTDEDTDKLKEYLLAQYADGWAEGFEQREIYSFTEIETAEEYDEEADEYYESEWEERNDVYISFWQSKGFKIMTEAELKS